MKLLLRSVTPSGIRSSSCRCSCSRKRTVGICDGANLTEDGTMSSLSRGKLYLTATAKVRYRGKTGFAARRLPLEQADVRRTRRLLQQSYYLAAIQVLDTVPPVGRAVRRAPDEAVDQMHARGRLSERRGKTAFWRRRISSRRNAAACASMPRATRWRLSRLSEPTDLSVYIGIPFCPTRCSYCSFVSESIERFGAFLPPYLAALHREIEYTGKLLARRPGTTSARYTWAAARRRRFPARRCRLLLAAINREL